MKNKTNKLLCLLLAVMMLLGVMAPAALAAPMTFPDVKPSDWFYADVQKAVDTKLINGYPDGTFGPRRNMLYSEAIKLAAVMYKYSTTGDPEFEAGSPWYQSYVDYAKDVGMISKDYPWNSEATRAGYMEIFAKAIPDMPALAGMKGLTAINTVPDGSIPDVPATHPQAGAIYKLYRAGILQGSDTQHSCRPDSSILRSEVAAILTRMMNADERISFSMGSQTAELKITAQPQDTTVQAGQDAVFTVTASGGKTPYKYEWHQVWSGGDSVAAGPNFGGVGTASLTSKACAASENGDKYYCVVTDAEGKKVTSNKATLTVTAAAAPLQITTQPESVTTTKKTPFSFSVEVSGGKAPYTYQWIMQYGGIEQIKDGGNWIGATTAKVTHQNGVSSSMPHNFYCVITDAAGNKVESNKVKMTVTESVDELKITDQPESDTVNQGSGINFVVKVSGGKAPYTFVWYQCYPGASTFTKVTDMAEHYEYYGISDQGSASVLSVKKAGQSFDQNGIKYRCEITDANGAKVTSNAATLTVNAVAGILRITTQPQNTTVTEGGDATFTVVVTGGKAPYKYEWHYIDDNGDTLIEESGYFVGAAAPTLISKNCAAYESGDQYYCIVTDANNARAISAKATLTVK